MRTPVPAPGRAPRRTQTSGADASATETAGESDSTAAHRSARDWRGLGALLAGREGPRRLLVEGGIVLGAGAVAGIGAALAAAAAMVLVRLRGPRPGLLITAGAALVLLSAVAYVAQIALVDGTLGSVSADSVRSALVPHHIAGAGVALAVIGTFLRHDPPEEKDT